MAGSHGYPASGSLMRAGNIESSYIDTGSRGREGKRRKGRGKEEERKDALTIGCDRLICLQGTDIKCVHMQC
jgi:hypothetical protein